VRQTSSPATTWRKRYKDVLMYRIDGEEILGGFGASMKSATDAGLIHTLRDLGDLRGRSFVLSPVEDRRDFF
jgi:hypothetical protein